MTDIED